MDQSKRTAALALAAGALAVAGAAQAQVRLPGRGKPADKGAMDHSKMATGADVSLSPAEMNVVTTLSQCSMAAEQCLSLCIEQLAVGDTTMGECARSVRDVIALCETSKTLSRRAARSRRNISHCVARPARPAKRHASRTRCTTPPAGRARKPAIPRSPQSTWFSSEVSATRQLNTRRRSQPEGVDRSLRKGEPVRAAAFRELVRRR